ncbi:MAG: ASKHA domain-containing protein [Clostridia bacterium]|nr:ASKHA domain-containing protein [Clostridia bacterium]
MYRIKLFQGEKEIEISAHEGQNLLEALNESGIYLDAPCGGHGFCGKCKVRVKGDKAEKCEIPFLSDKEHQEGYRLACIKKIDNDMEVILPENFRAEALTKGINRKISNIYHCERGFAAAVDIGTTTIAISLIDMKTMQTIDSLAQINRQKAYGADVISRITYCMEHTGGIQTLQTCVVSQLQQMLDIVLKKNHISPKELKKTVAAGNTFMQHLLVGADISGFAAAPFKPAFLDGLVLNAKKLGFGFDFSLYVMPSVSAYVGGDIVSAMLACSMESSEEINLLIDIGTNGEMVVGKKGIYYACSVAAGPAFEGSHIRHGTGSVDGAIDHVILHDGTVEITTIHKKPSIGICGSGIVDITAELLKHDILSKDGRLRTKAEVESCWRKYILEPDAGFRLTKNIKITQQDIREVQLAKAAFSAGIKMLLTLSKNGCESIDHVYLAGGMGSFIDKENASYIGLLPKVLKDKVIVCGNAALSGAVSIIRDERLFDTAQSLARKVKTIELGKQELFQKLYIKEMNF